MRLIRLGLLNFRQHADTQIEFGSGLIGIVGPNGAGKSTILEAIAWAIYGSAAARGTNDTIRFARAPGRSRVEVELVFALAGHEYRVVRSLSNAEVFLDGDPAPVATTLGGTSEYLQRRLGMSRQEFFNTYFTGQKELQFLAQMGAAERGRFLGQVLGYERLRDAQERARDRRKELRHETDGLRAGLPDPRELADARTAAATRRKEARAALAAAETAHAGAAAALEEVRPRWEAAQAARDAAREAAGAAEAAATELERAQRELARAQAELEAVTAAATELAPLREALRELPPLQEECAAFARRAREAERRRALLEAEKAAAGDLARTVTRLEQLAQAPALLEQYSVEVRTLRADHASATEAAQKLNAAWSSERGEGEARLRSYRDRAAELKEQIRQLREAGPDGVCPTCERPLGKNFETVVGRLEEEWDKLVQDGKWLKRRLDQLQARPDDVAAADARVTDLQRILEDRTTKVARCESGVAELKQLGTERGEKEQRLTAVRRELEELPADYDAERHRGAESRLTELRTVEKRAAALEHALSARPAREAELREADSRAAAARERAQAALRRRAETAEAGARFDTVRQEHDLALATLRAAELRATELRGVLATATEALETAKKAEAAYQQRRAALDALELELRHHNDLDAALTQLRDELNARVRPELSELASSFLADITEGRYTSLDIDESYDILVLDEGEEKPVISGGEEDVANLVLRLAVSQMIAERAGYPLSILILDEVFGSLDIERRDAVVELLHKLEDRFEQVILITHIETIREGLDHVLRVSFDEKTGASVVTVEDVPSELEPA